MFDTPAGTPATPPADEPKGLLDKLGAALPVALTAVATAFAGLSTTELQRSMYWKSQAAQDQSKAANQWGLFGFKRSRALEMEVAAARGRSDSGYLRFRFDLPTGAPAEQQEAVRWLNGDGPPRTELPPPDNADLAQLVKDIRDRKPEADLAARAARVPLPAITTAIDGAEEFIARTTDVEWDAVMKAARAVARKDVEAAGRAAPADAVDPAKKARADAAQGLLYALEERRYRAEGALNNALGYLYEARVRWSAAESDKHRKKSETFFYAMLAAQVGATVSALGLARKHKSLLWTVAGLAGVVSVAIGAYVYLT
ncbi:MAG: hypothetical protein K2X82_11615 [Gemmataceae bacterium]|nr:hypothetical protein [Gemmataceae bacterium]